MYVQKKNNKEPERRAVAASRSGKSGSGMRRAGVHPDRRRSSPIFQLQSDVIQLQKKELPQFLYRWDPLTPGQVAAWGLPQRYAEGNVSLERHVLGSHEDGKPNYADSQWMSTGEWGMLENLDPLFGQKGNRTLYKIDPQKAQTDSEKEFVNVEEHFKKLGKDQPYPAQHEWALEGRISPKSIVGYMKFTTLIQNYKNFGQEGKTLGPITVKEDDLKGWKTLPDPSKDDQSINPEYIRKRK